MALYLQLDVNWPDDDPIIEVGLEAAGLHAMLMCLAKRLETDGWVSRALLNRYGATDALVALLAGSTPPLIEVDGNRVRPSGWLKWNPSKAALDARRSAKSEAGRKGNHVRHRHGGDYEDCPLCHVEDQQVVAGSDRTRSQTQSGAIAETSPETEGEGASDRTSSHLGFAGPKPVAALAAVKDVLHRDQPDPTEATA